ncbi:MAG: SDR family NAD(P)-dependent oxidoreductase [Lacisediminihabitans sp.]
MTFNPMGTTALITGASSGLGVEFAHRLAERGADLVLVARRKDRLEALAAELTSRFGTVCTVIALDLTRPGAVATLVSTLTAENISLSTLVNNAGFGNHGFFVGLDPAAIDREVRLNVSALVALSRAFLPELLSAAKTGNSRTALINVASTAAFQPIPRMAIYAATKAFVLSFTEALSYETRSSGLKVLALCPGPTSTEFFEVNRTDDAASGKFQTAEEVIATALGALDRKRTPASVISGRMNAAQAAAERFAPRSLVLNLVGRMGAPKQR